MYESPQPISEGLLRQAQYRLYENISHAGTVPIYPAHIHFC